MRNPTPALAFTRIMHCELKRQVPVTQFMFHSALGSKLEEGEVRWKKLGDTM